MATIWKIRVEASEASIREARSHLTRHARNRVTVTVDDVGPSLAAVVLDTGKPPDFAPVPLGEPPFAAPLARHPGELQPAPRWLIAVDDTGSTWAGDAPEGRLVALVLGEGATLPRLPRSFHAAQAPQLAAEAVAHMLRSPIGVLGMRAAAVPDLHTEERWRVALVALLERVLLLLPPQATAEPAHVQVVVEQHAGVTAGDNMGALVEAVLMGVRRARGGGPPGFRLAIAVVSKGQHDAVQLADAVAYAWGKAAAQRPSAVDAYQARGLLPETALADAVVDAIPAALGAQEFDPRLWRRLCSWAEATATPGLAHTLRDRFEATGAGRSEWLGAAVEANQALLYSRSFQAGDLRRDADSLRRMGRARDTDPEVALGLGAALLAEQNRSGSMPEAQDAAALQAQAHSLLDELPAAATELCLRLAVAHTNALAWDAVEAALPGPDAPLPCVWRGRVESTRAQLAANRGDAFAAEAHFQAAMHLFARLQSGQGPAETRQTGAYRLANRWALPPAGVDADRRAVAVRQSLDGSRLRELLRGGDPHQAWAQLDVLRWMAARPGDTEQEREALFDVAHAWHTGAAHPWPLISLYRALVLRAADADPEDLANALHRCVEDAAGPDAGPAVRLIAHAAEVHRLALCGQVQSPRLTSLHSGLRVHLPRASAYLDRGQALLRGGADWRGGEWLHQLLPFSFR